MNLPIGLGASEIVYIYSKAQTIPSSGVTEKLLFGSVDCVSTRLIVKELVKVQKNASKTLLYVLFTYLPYFKRKCSLKGGFWGLFGSISLSVGVNFVHWGAFLELIISSENQGSGIHMPVWRVRGPLR